MDNDPSMDHVRWRKLSHLLDELLDVDTTQRETRIAVLAESDPETAEVLSALLAEGRELERDDFLQRGVLELGLRPSLAGQQIGSYRLERRLGQGGMGSVWLAHRCDGRYEGKVAIKLLHLALLDHGGLARFQQEGHALARLTHPNVARLIDAGVSAAGQPYLVLEYVDGAAVDEYCDQKGLDVPARVRLMLDLLDVVAHAHGKLILHRDLKPSNILITADGQPKLLDFGIATLLQHGCAGASALTKAVGAAFTPEYASPEQIEGSELTTASDVYSLGVLLHLILVGELPRSVERAAALHRPEPRRMSDSAATLPAAVAQRRRSSARQLSRILRGDLDNIVATALKSDSSQRYSTVTALADDLRRYLKREPISARPDSLRYRTLKFVSRNRALVAVAALALCAATLGVTAVVLEGRRAAQSAATAQLERARADDAVHVASEQRDFALSQLARNEFINDLNMFLLADGAPLRTPMSIKELLTKAEQVIDRQQPGEDDSRLEMLTAIGCQFMLQGAIGDALRVLAKAQALASASAEPGLLARSKCMFASALAKAGAFERAAALVEEADRALPRDPRYAVARTFCMLRSSEVARAQGDATAAIERARSAERMIAAYDPAPPMMLKLRVALYLAEAYRIAQRPREASRSLREASERLTALGRDQTQTSSAVLNKLGTALLELGRPRDAERALRRALDIRSLRVGDPGPSPEVFNNLATVMLELGRVADAATWVERARRLADIGQYANALDHNLLLRAEIAWRQGARKELALSLAELKQRVARNSPQVDALTRVALARALSEQARARGNSAAALAAADEAVSLAETEHLSAGDLADVLTERSMLELASAHAQAAEADARRALQLAAAVADPSLPSSKVGRGLLALGQALAALHQPGEAIATCASARTTLEAALGEDHAAVRTASACSALESKL